MTDDRDAAVADRHYDFAESHTINTTTGTTVSVADAYKRLSGGEYTGFYYSRCESSVVVKGDNSKVLNVYYDREKVVYRFYNSYDDYSRNRTPAETWTGLYG